MPTPTDYKPGLRPSPLVGATPEQIVERLFPKMRWHQFAKWCPVEKPEPYPGACGNCGRHEDEHPFPWLCLEGECGGLLLLALMQQFDGTTDGD
jgi:hypothetical protein